MQISLLHASISGLFVVCSVLDVYTKFLEYFLGFLLMDCLSFLKFLSGRTDFESGFVVFGCLVKASNLFSFFLLFGLGLKVLQYVFQRKGLVHFLWDFRVKSIDLTNGFYSENDFDGTCKRKFSSCKSALLKFLKISKPTIIAKSQESKRIVHCNGAKVGDSNENKHGDSDTKANSVSDEKYVKNDDDGSGKPEYCEDDVVDVMALRKLIKMERCRANAACLEVEKERMAAATAAEEAMAMILRLQKAKSSVELEANQYRRLAREKQFHDQVVIQSLRRIVMRHELERSVLEDQLRLCKQKLRSLVKSDEEDQFGEADEFLNSVHSDIDCSLNDMLISSLDIDLSPC